MEKRGDDGADRTAAERDDSRTKVPLKPKETRTWSVPEDREGQKESSVEYKGGRMIESSGDSTAAWSSLELHMNCGHSQKGSSSGRVYLLAFVDAS